jgi:glutamate-5-semialdehyde dehydrogenase
VAALDDPVGRVLEGHIGPDGLIVQKLSVPIGVIAIIYESRPNVTTDAASVCLKSGNAVILRGGSEAKGTNLLIAESMREALKEARLPEDCVQIIKDSDHKLVSDMLAMDQYIDLVIPRGGKGLIKRIAQGTSIPVLKHYEGICHQYIAEDARSDWAVDIVVNSKCQSVEVCNALESVLIHQKAGEAVLPLLGEALTDRGVEIRGCERVCKILKNALPARRRIGVLNTWLQSSL